MTILKNKVVVMGAVGMLLLLALGYWEQTRNEGQDIPLLETSGETPRQQEPQNTPELPDFPEITGQLTYPEDYVLLPEEVPKGFELEPLSDEAKKLGFTSNPGFFNNPELHQILYDEVNSSAIENVYVSGYAKPEAPSTELGIFAIQYSSKEAFETELPKILATSKGIYATKPIYLRHADVLLIIWADTANYKGFMEEAASSLETRLGLVRISG